MELYDVIGGNIIIDDMSTWPNQLKIFLQDNKSVIERYFIEENNYNERIKEDINARVEKFTNKYILEMNEIKKGIKSMLEGERILAFHATRLFPYEIEEIIRDSLKLTSCELLNSRLEKAVDNGIISHDESYDIKHHNLADDKHRKNMICTVITKSTLINDGESGFSSLLSNWGGEVVWKDCMSSFGQTEFGRRVNSASIPCIVILDVLFNNIIDEKKSILFLEGSDLELWICKMYLYNEYYIDNLDEINGINLFSYVDLAVLKVVEKEDELFEKLIKYKSWDTQI